MKEQCFDFAKESLEQSPEVVSHMLAPDSLLRFLVAREFSLENSVDMFKKSLEWRLKFEPEKITVDSIKDLLMN